SFGPLRIYRPRTPADGAEFGEKHLLCFRLDSGPKVAARPVRTLAAQIVEDSLRAPCPQLPCRTNRVVPHQHAVLVLVPDLRNRAANAEKAGVQVPERLGHFSIVQVVVVDVAGMLPGARSKRTACDRLHPGHQVALKSLLEEAPSGGASRSENQDLHVQTLPPTCPGICCRFARAIVRCPFC